MLSGSVTPLSIVGNLERAEKLRARPFPSDLTQETERL